jgi:hypothetical protein
VTAPAQGQNTAIHRPDVTFRAARNYVHSTDLYEELLRGAAAIGAVPDGPVELKFRRLLTNQPAFHYARSLSDLPANAPVVFSLAVAGEMHHGAVVDRNTPVSDRRPYDEAPIWKCAVHQGQAIEVAIDTGMRPIEVVTALGVLLHRRSLPPPADRKWLLTRLELNRPLSHQDVRQIRIECARVTGTMTRSRVESHCGLAGTMDFMLGRG